MSETALLMERWSDDDRFGIRISKTVMRRILDKCKRCHPLETGGILIGKYSRAHDCAVVTSATGAPADSRRGETWFVRGVRNLKKLLDISWREKKEFYLGEWHYHPSASPNPSGQDTAQMEVIAKSQKCGCPEPLLLIVGGDFERGYSFRVFVFPRGKKSVELTR